MDPTESLLRERYGRRRSRRAWVPFAVLATVAGLGWLTWATAFHGAPPAESDMVGYQVLDGRTAEARIAVPRRDADVEASCLVRAQADDHTVVGETRFTVGPGGEPQGVYVVTVRTERPATAVELMGCVADGQLQRR